MPADVAPFLSVDTITSPKNGAGARSAPTHPLWRRYCYILLMAAWMGGFTFYAVIVIPTAERILDSMRETGFITQQVTRWLNLIGVGVLLIIVSLGARGWRKLPSRFRLGFASTWALMALAQTALFITHALMDQHLEAAGRKLHQFEMFESLHTVYLVFATTQWCAALVQIWIVLALWRRQDGEQSASES